LGLAGIAPSLRLARHGFRQGSLCPLQRCAESRVVDHKEELAILDVVSLFNSELHDSARNVSADVNRRFWFYVPARSYARDQIASFDVLSAYVDGIATTRSDGPYHQDSDESKNPDANEYFFLA
jgi:hypothetical protein